MMTSVGLRFFLHATNVHAGGGQLLLNSLLRSLSNDLCVVALLDSRMVVKDIEFNSLDIKRVKPSVWTRLKADWWLARNVKPSDVVLCFGNLPPLFQLRGSTIVFLQNRYLIDRISLESFPLKTRWRLKVERLWFFWKAGNADAFIVQTPSMHTILGSSGLAARKPVHVLPFVDICEGYRRCLEKPLSPVVDKPLIYVASGEPHKNHRNLIQAWCLLAQDGLFPNLWLTLDAQVNRELCEWIEKQTQQFCLGIKNLGAQPHEKILFLYTQVQALIYPSTFESFGLPLIEARRAGLAVLASELDFVRDVLDPEQVFDPQSPVSIARAVKRFMGANEDPLPLLNADEFMKSLLEMCE